ncbi:MAG: tRNA glutamyl-Q(34) synthetase GluQRS [Desulfovibrio sp.]|jgi:glutamyl-tRNA synthetase|nr:tRNA glutamyl-Q(34) synthetase GluQRS [Desulfovibrio sp.]
MRHKKVYGRLAPSPTGYIHLGNAWAFLLAWLAARSQKGVLILRIEDIDAQRSRAEFAAALLEDLRWLGIDWDYGPDTKNAEGANTPYEQSKRTPFYEEALDRLSATGMTYPCFCTRKELRLLASAPHDEDAGAPYPGTCRALTGAQQKKLFQSGRKAAVRLRCPDAPVVFHDAVQGAQRRCLPDCGGDFALRRSDGVIAYQLATTVDDALMGITQVVRGRDILLSTPRQIALFNLLGYTAPMYAHIPLLKDRNGERLAKRHKSLALRTLRSQGVDNRRIVGLLGHYAGLNPAGHPCRPQELLAGFSLERLPKTDITVTDKNLHDLLLRS